MKRKRTYAAIGAALAASPAAFAQGQAQAGSSYFSNPVFNGLLTAIALLLILILALSSVLKNIAGSGIAEDKFRKNTGRGAAMIFLLLFAGDLVAASGQTDPGLVAGMDPAVFWTMIVIILGEALVAAVLMRLIKQYVRSESETAKAAAPKKKEKTVFARLNDAVEVEKEADILLDHDYDGIKELDNNLPPWWKYGFYITIFVAVGYLINYHITKSSPLQVEEYKLEVAAAEAEIAEYMKNSADNVDETTVKLLTDAAELAAGREVYMMNCSVCHGKAGEGTVGPNLTDEYWLHAGGVADIFKSIKYGWPDKGMKSWKDELSPKQIAQITSYIKSISGTNPPHAKEKQGDLYQEASPLSSDSTKTVAGLAP